MKSLLWSSKWSAQAWRAMRKYDANHKVAWRRQVEDPFDAGQRLRKCARGDPRSVRIYPNVAVIGAKAFSGLKHHPKVTDRFKYV